jgi:hypothetical protein
MLTAAAGIVFGFLVGASVILWTCLQYASVAVPLRKLLCLYGYSLTIFVPAAVRLNSFVRFSRLDTPCIAVACHTVSVYYTIQRHGLVCGCICDCDVSQFVGCELVPCREGEGTSFLRGHEWCPDWNPSRVCVDHETVLFWVVSAVSNSLNQCIVDSIISQLWCGKHFVH